MPTMAEVTRPFSPKASKSPETVAFHSSFLQSATYDAEQYSLTISLKSGDTLIYKYVYPQVWQQFKEHPSKGSFYAKSIKGQHEAVALKKPLLVSDLTQAKKKFKGGNLISKFPPSHSLPRN